MTRTLYSAPASYWMGQGLERLAESWARQYAWIGPVLVEKGQKTALKQASTAEFARSQLGTRIALMNARGVNEASEMLSTEVDLVVGSGFEMHNGQPHLICSLRSQGKYDCGALAKRFGGGGHRGAAGMSLKLAEEEDPRSYQRVIDAINLHEGAR